MDIVACRCASTAGRHVLETVPRGVLDVSAIGMVQVGNKRASVRMRDGPRDVVRVTILSTPS